MLCYALRLRMVEHIATALACSFKQLLQLLLILATPAAAVAAAAPATPPAIVSY